MSEKSRFRKDAQELLAEITRPCGLDGPDYPVESIMAALERLHRLTREKTLREAAEECHCERKRYAHECGQDVPANLIRDRILALSRGTERKLAEKVVERGEAKK